MTAVRAPLPNCCICIQDGNRVPATTTVVDDDRDYLACDEHADQIVIRGFVAAALQVKPTTKGAL